MAADDGSKVKREIIVHVAKLEVEIFIFCNVPTAFERVRARSVPFNANRVMSCRWLEVSTFCTATLCTFPSGFRRATVERRKASTSAGEGMPNVVTSSVPICVQ